MSLHGGNFGGSQCCNPVQMIDIIIKLAISHLHTYIHNWTRFCGLSSSRTAMLAYIHCDSATRHVRHFMVKRTLHVYMIHINCQTYR